MSWLKWILAYLFDCVHPHTTWPHRDRVDLAYVCCIDCGRCGIAKSTGVPAWFEVVCRHFCCDVGFSRYHQRNRQWKQ
jgi:hypothetical protein